VPDLVVEQPSLFEVVGGPGSSIGKRLTLFECDGCRAIYLGPTAIHVYDSDDKEAGLACIATLSRAGLASDIEIAAGFGIHRNTVGRIVRRFETGGMAAVVPAKRGPKGPFKVTPKVLEIIAANTDLPRKVLQERILEATGVLLSLPYLSQLAASYRPRQGELACPEHEEAGATRGPVDAASAAMIDDRDDTESDDVECDDDDDGDTDDAEDEAELEPARDGLVFDPPVSLPSKVSGRYVGLALYYPALAAVGLVEVARSLFSLPSSLRFGVRATTLCLFFMTVLSKTTLEAAKHLRRAEFGAMIGSDRAPCVKTLRRKLAELVTQGQAGAFGVALARRWVDTGLLGSAYLYVDGHMKVYSGKRRLQEVWNSQRRMPLPGIHSYFVGDEQGRPLLFLTEELSANLAKAMPSVIAAIKEVLGERRFCVIFDRGGYDGKLFGWLVEQKIDFITYQRGNPKLADDAFARRETRFEGRRVRFLLAEDDVRVGRSGPWRRVVVRSGDAHQTPIITSLRAAPAARIAALMFARWRQENLFKYMGAHHGLDEIVSYGAEPADPDALIANPKRKVLDRRIAEIRKEFNALKAELGAAVLDEPKLGGRSVHGLKAAQGGAVKKMRELEASIVALTAERRKLPARVSVGEAGVGKEVMRREAKAIVDRIKIASYNAEEWLLDRLVVHYPNHFDVRDLLRSFAELSGTIETTTTGVLVSLDPPDTPAHRRALRGLVEDLNAAGATFPGTKVPVSYRVRMHHAEQVA
jgi:transposase